MGCSALCTRRLLFMSSNQEPGWFELPETREAPVVQVDHGRWTPRRVEGAERAGASGGGGGGYGNDVVLPWRKHLCHVYLGTARELSPPLPSSTRAKLSSVKGSLLTMWHARRGAHETRLMRDYVKVL